MIRLENNWYKLSQEEAWYAPQTVRAGAPVDAPAKEARSIPRSGGMSEYAPPRESRLTWIPWVLAALLLIAVIAASSLLFGSRSVPAEISLPSVGGIGSEFGGDFREFFENYYTPFEAHKECTIQRVDELPDGEMLLVEDEGEDMPLQDIYSKCSPSVVAITAYPDETKNDSYYWGTGVILSADGLIITNAHVVEGTCRATVTLWDDTELEAKLVGYDSRSDIAILKIQAADLQPAEFCAADSLRVGDSVVAIGNPLGKEFRSTMTEGIISGIGRGVSYNGTTLTLLQTTAPINEGNSGGPLINLRGQVIGITNMKMSANYLGSVTIEGVGFAIPVATVKNMTDSILTNGKVLGRPALGLTVGPIPDSAMAEYDLPDGLYISAVAEGSDCFAKEIQTGDILLSADGKPVTETEDLTRILEEKQVGDTLILSLWRKSESGEGTTFEVEVSLVDVSDIY